MERFLTPKVQGALRHLLTAVGPVLAIFLATPDPIEAAKSLISEAGWQSTVGLLLALLGFYASWRAPEKK